MIERKALWISGPISLAMIGASIWRLNLLPDWHLLPVGGPGDSHTVNGLTLFISPACLLFVMAVLFARKWFVFGPEENVRPWQKWYAMMLIAYTGIVAVMQTFVLARSLGFGTGLDRLTVSHVILALIGGLLMILGNAMPKLPWLSVRFRPFRLDPWQWNRHLRFMGRIMVGLGFFAVAGSFLLPPDLFRPIMLCLWLAGVTAGIFYRIKLRREPSAL